MVASLDVAIAYMRHRGLPTGVFGAIRELYAQAAVQGLGKKDHSAVLEVMVDPGS
jgi:3-hydroxyisobutyrate dehydrogenase-like beta-hydroxyacid dehydrogenase